MRASLVTKSTHFGMAATSSHRPFTCEGGAMQLCKLRNAVQVNDRGMTLINTGDPAANHKA